MDKPLPALPELDNTYYDYMFPEASYDQQNDDGDEGQLVGIEEDSGKSHFSLSSFLSNSLTNSRNLNGGPFLAKRIFLRLRCSKPVNGRRG